MRVPSSGIRRLLPCILALALAASASGAEKKTAPKTAAKKTEAQIDTSTKKPGTRSPSKPGTGESDGEKKPAAKGSTAGTKGREATGEGTAKKSTPKSPGKTAERDAAAKPQEGAKSASNASAKPAGAQTDDTKRAAKVAPKPALHDDSGEDVAQKPAEPNASLRTDELEGFDDNPARVQRLIRAALDLTRRGLTYRYGSADPKEGGMDCSGTVYYSLRQVGFEPPRDSTGMYLWAKEAGTLREVRPASLDDSSLRDMRPGDLAFWEGTYSVRRNPPISHVMIYLGREKATGAPVMVGASDGRSYRGKRRNGVSVFDFKLPKAGSNAKFVGYGRVPGI